ncbi:hypothetical protein [Streptomyces sp. ADMS]|uniref:hypothetical protein n=1 Tax=Streptomyces sp. ADMS TaxID=3071415 RepID=UPI0039921959
MSAGPTAACGRPWRTCWGRAPSSPRWTSTAAVVRLSPEAATVSTAFTASPDVAADVFASASGRELIDGGFPEDVAIATEVDASAVVPVLVDGAFVAATV